MFISEFKLPTDIEEENYIINESRLKKTCYTTIYPFGIFENRRPNGFNLGPITIFYGGNGSGKTTLLNLIAEKLELKRTAVYNKSPFWENYVNLCEVETMSNYKNVHDKSEVITSDDVFDYILNVRCFNQELDKKRENLLLDYIEKKNSSFQFKSLDDYDLLKQYNAARTKTSSQYVKDYSNNNVLERSNGESAYFYFTNKIKEDALYLLDEPENSLSIENQIRLKDYIESAVRFYNCQFIIASHSPFLMSLRDAFVYDLDQYPICRKKWYELSNMQEYYNFFNQYKTLFEAIKKD